MVISAPTVSILGQIKNNGSIGYDLLLQALICLSPEPMRPEPDLPSLSSTSHIGRPGFDRGMVPGILRRQNATLTAALGLLKSKDQEA